MVFPIVGGNQSSGDFVTNSLRFNDDDSPSLSLDLSSPNTDKFTISFWVKLTGARTQLASLGKRLTGEAGDDASINIEQGSTGRMGISSYNGVADANVAAYNSNTSEGALLRDVSAWYNIIYAFDTGQGTAGNRLKWYINGVLQSGYNTTTVPSQNADLFPASGSMIRIGRALNTESRYGDMYIAQYYYVDGQQYDHTYFGETDDNGVWVPVENGKGAGGAITFGTNGFYLEFKQTGTDANSSGIGADTSGNDKHLTPANLAATDITTDTPQNNFTVFRPHGFPQDSKSVLSEGNLDFDFTGDGNTGGRSLAAHVVSNIGVTQGKWYAEFKLTEDANGGFVGVSNLSNKIHTGDIESYNYIYTDDGNKYVREHTGESESNAAHGAAVSVNDIVQVALDADNRNVYFGKGGSWASGSGAWNQATPTSAVSYTADFVTTDSHGVVVFNAAAAGSSETPRWQANFGSPPFAISSGNSDANGHGNFEYAVPTGYYALNTKNLADFG